MPDASLQPRIALFRRPRDDRGEAYHPRGESGLAALRQRATVEQRQLLRRLAPSRSTNTTIVASMIIIFVAMTVVVGATTLPRWLAYVSVGLVGPPIGLAVRRFGLWPTISQALVEHGICPCCAYSLAGLEAQEDGCVVCSECGSAWRAKRIRTFVDPAPASERVASRPSALAAWERQEGSDDRGRRVPMVAPSELREMIKSPRDSSLAERQRRALERLGAAGRGYRRVLTGVVVLVLGAPLILAAIGFVWGAPQPLTVASAFQAVRNYLGAIASVGLYLYLVGAAWRSGAGRPPKVVRTIMLDEGLCASCGGTLEGAAAGDDGLAECAACGAAWRVGPG